MHPLIIWLIASVVFAFLGLMVMARFSHWIDYMSCESLVTSFASLNIAMVTMVIGLIILVHHGFQFKEARVAQWYLAVSISLFLTCGLSALSNTAIAIFRARLKAHLT